MIAGGHPRADALRLSEARGVLPRGCVVSTDALFQLIWGTESLEDTRTVAVHISNLRKKIEADPAAPERIVTVRGAGYMLVAGNALQART